MVNCFLLFCLDNRSSLSDSNPKLSNAEITSILGKLWQELPNDKKEHYKYKSKQLTPPKKKISKNNQKQYIFKFKVNKTKGSEKTQCESSKQKFSSQVPELSCYNVYKPIETPRLPSIRHLLLYCKN